MGDYKNLRIKEWALEDRPREKLLNKGIGSLSDAELIAILIGSGSQNETAVEVAKKILNSVKNDLNQLGKLNVDKNILRIAPPIPNIPAKNPDKAPPDNAAAFTAGILKLDWKIKKRA